MTSDERKILDVAKPDTTPADESSKPVIVGHRPMVLDPMVNEEKKIEQTTAKQSVTQSTRKLEPTSSEVKPETKQTSTTSSKSTAADAEQVTKKPESQNEADILAETQAKEAEFNELVMTKKYFVETSNPTKSSAKAFIITVVSVLLVGSMALALLHDAGVIDLGIKLPFDLIK